MMLDSDVISDGAKNPVREYLACFFTILSYKICFNKGSSDLEVCFLLYNFSYFFGCRRKGAMNLINALVAGIIIAWGAVSLAKVHNMAFQSKIAENIAMQAHHYAAAKGDLVKLTAYNDLKNQSKSVITGSDFYDEVLVGNEISVDSSTKKREVKINVYKGHEMTPRSSLVVPKYTKDEAPGGCQIVTGSDNVSFAANGSYKSVTVIVSSKYKPTDGTWTGSAEFYIKVDDSLIGILGTETKTSKSGSKGHYWGTTEAVTNQMTVAANIVKRSTVSVNLGTYTKNRYDTSTVTVILGS